MSDSRLDDFEKAFSSRSAGSVRRCQCGRLFYNPHGGWTWDEGELEELESDSTATALEYAVGMIECEGRGYVPDCDCWHKRALQIIGFIEGHDEAIAEYLSLQKERKQAEATRSPVVRGT